MFLVYYIDDFGNKHRTVANSMAELSFIKERFDTVDYEVIEK